MRFCPQCSLILEPVDWNGAQVHVCRSCGGCWLAKGEFESVADPEMFGELDGLFPSAAHSGMFEGLSKACPICRTSRLERREAMPGVNPLTCAQCGGIWLQAGEPGLRDVERHAGAPGQPESSGCPAAERVEPVESGQADPTPDPQSGPLPVVEERAITETSADHAANNVEPRTAEYVPDVAGPLPAIAVTEDDEIEPPDAASGPAASVAVSWLPPVSATMPDPRPLSRRGAPLTGDVDDEETAPSIYAARRWCPQCRRPYFADELECSYCRTGLAEASYRVRCFRCGNENTLAADRCWNCHAMMHPDPDDAMPAAAPPPLAPTSDSRRDSGRRAGMAPPSSSCGGSVFLLIVAGGAATALLRVMLKC